jgi:hypothetical protein
MLAVNHVNHAPTWSSGSPAFVPVLPGSSNPPAEPTVAALFGSYFHDIDPGTTTGIAVTALTGTGDGTWQYLTSGGTSWTNFPTVSTTAALLLSGNDVVHFLPGAGFTGQVTLSADAWDGSMGSDGGTANLLGSGKTGGASAFSTTTITATLAVNNAPTLGSMFSEFNLPSNDSQEITAGNASQSDNNLWFTDGNGNTIGEINAATHEISEFPVPTPNSDPHGITTAPNGTIWFTELNGNKIGEINPLTDAITEFATRRPIVGPTASQ